MSYYKWDEGTIEQTIFLVIEELKLDRFPTAIEMQNVTGDRGLVTAVSKYGGFPYWAKQLNLEQKDSKSKAAMRCEKYVFELLRNHLVPKTMRLTSYKFPYDILYNDKIKIEVKFSNIKDGRYRFFLPKMPKSDVTILVCYDQDKKETVYVIPSHMLKNQHIVINDNDKYSKYKKWIDRYSIIDLIDYSYHQLKMLI